MPVLRRLVRQFGFRTVVVGESETFRGGLDELRAHGVVVIEMHSQACVDILAKFIAEKPEVWNEDIGVD